MHWLCCNWRTCMPQVDVLMVGGRQYGPDSALAVVLLAVLAVGVLDGLSQGAIFGDAADLPPVYTHVSPLDGGCGRGLHRR